MDQVKRAARDSQGFQSGTPLSETDIQKLLGNVIIFKIAEVKFAQPGLYPILKPREVRQWLKGKNVVTNEDADSTFEAFIADSMAPWIRPDMAFIPCPPFTMVGFNATTDVFLLPATERVALESAAESQPASTAKSNTDATNTSLAAIVGKLKAAFGEFPQKDKTTTGAIADGKATDAATTRIEIAASPGQSFATQKADLTKITTWASAALKATAEETTTTAEGTTKLLIAIAADPSSLAERQ